VKAQQYFLKQATELRYHRTARRLVALPKPPPLRSVGCADPKGEEFDEGAEEEAQRISRCCIFDPSYYCSTVASAERILHGLA
jgi:hypothetical protein